MYALIPSKFGEQSKDAKERRLAIATLLVKHDPSSIELACHSGVLPVHVASYDDDPGLIDVVMCPRVLNHQTNFGETPVCIAAGANKIHSLAHLLKLGATEGAMFTREIFRRNGLGGGALANATNEGAEGAVRMLTSTEYLARVGGEPVLNYAMLGAISQGNARVLQILLDVGRLGTHAPEKRANDRFHGQSLLRLAASKGKLSCLSKLLSNGATVRASDLAFSSDNSPAAWRMMQRVPAFRATLWTWPSRKSLTVKARPSVRVKIFRATKNNKGRGRPLVSLLNRLAG